MSKNTAAKPKTVDRLSDRWAFPNFKAEAIKIAAFAIARGKYNYHHGYGVGNLVSFRISRASRTRINRIGRGLHLNREDMLILLAREIEIALKEEHSQKKPEVVCTKRHIQVKL